ncbi:MAG: HepT-like ribonuclease domain-containing protein [Armatimonadota bacterium]
MLPDQDIARLRHILEYANKIDLYTVGLTQDIFQQTSIVQDSVLHCLYVICEAAGRITDETKQQLPQIDWDLLRGMRNRLAHAYFSIDLAIIWKTATEDVPELVRLVKEILAENL